MKIITLLISFSIILLLLSCTDQRTETILLEKEVKELENENAQLRKKISSLSNKEIITNNIYKSSTKTPNEFTQRCVNALKNIDINELKKLGINPLYLTCEADIEQNAYNSSLFSILEDMHELCQNDFSNLVIDSIAYETQAAEIDTISEVAVSYCEEIVIEVFLTDTITLKKYDFDISGVLVEDSWRILELGIFSEINPQKKHEYLKAIILEKNLEKTSVVYTFNNQKYSSNVEIKNKNTCCYRGLQKGDTINIEINSKTPEIAKFFYY